MILFRPPQNKQASLSHEVAMQSRLIKLPRQDPADRFIAASAAVYDPILTTSDKYLIKAAESYAVLPNHFYGKIAFICNEKISWQSNLLSCRFLG